MKTPNAKQISRHDSLDEQAAREHFLGKTRAEAELLFRRNPIFYSEDLAVMGPIAFRFYLMALIDHIKGDGSAGETTSISCLIWLLELRAKAPKVLYPIAEEVIAACHYVLDNYSKFGAGEKNNGDLRPRYESMITLLRSL